jgi:serine/threonine protein kinase
VPASAQKLATPKRLTGQKVGKYTLGELLGQGGYGDVYVGEQKDGPNVAIKVLEPSAARDEDVITRFRREAETAQRLDHPNIVRVTDVGSSRQRHYLVMELVHGGSLRRLLQRGAPPDKILSILTDVARALAYAHEQGVVHRDVKPENVLLTKSRRAKVADFGLARAVDHSSMTTEGRLLGTAVYMSPEQAKGDRASAASDVYAFGIMLYEAICGELPFKADSQIGFLYQHAEVEPPRPLVMPPFPGALANIALACLAKNPADRPTMAKIAERLSQTSLVQPRRKLLLWLIPPAILLALLLALIARPSLLDPLCHDCAPARAARSAHHAIFGR